MDVAGTIAATQPNEPGHGQEQKPVAAQAGVGGHTVSADGGGAAAKIAKSPVSDSSKSKAPDPN